MAAATSARPRGRPATAASARRAGGQRRGARGQPQLSSGAGGCGAHVCGGMSSMDGPRAPACERGRGEGSPAVQCGEPGEYSGENAQGEARGEAVETVEGTYHRVPYASCYCTRAAAVT